MNRIRVEDWGLIEYREALARQESLVENVKEPGTDGVLVLCSHPPVVTLGRKGTAADLIGWRGDVVEISRGGEATYHGPAQLVIYPILNLTESFPGQPTRDLRWYLRTLEETLILTLSRYQVAAVGRSVREKVEGQAAQEETGVWLEGPRPRKIASLGIAVRHWVSFHGAAINLGRDPQAFTGIRACGFNASVMTSLEEVLGRPVDPAEFRQYLVEDFHHAFGVPR